MFEAVQSIGGITALAVIPMLYVLVITALYSRHPERRKAAERVLVILWPPARKTAEQPEITQHTEPPGTVDPPR